MEKEKRICQRSRMFLCIFIFALLLSLPLAIDGHASRYEELMEAAKVATVGGGGRASVAPHSASVSRFSYATEETIRQQETDLEQEYIEKIEELEEVVTNLKTEAERIKSESSTIKTELEERKTECSTLETKLEAAENEYSTMREKATIYGIASFFVGAGFTLCVSSITRKRSGE